LGSWRKRSNEYELDETTTNLERIDEEPGETGGGRETTGPRGESANAACPTEGSPPMYIQRPVPAMVAEGPGITPGGSPDYRGNLSTAG
jgi:hypothetical protein